MKNNMKDLRGFTLIELLAVIVVLAIIMLIAVNAALPQMAKARRSSFAIEANGAIDAAQSYYMSQNLVGGNGLPTTEGGVACVTVKQLYDAGQTELNPENGYEGKVVVKKQGNIYLYRVYLNKSDSLMIVNKGVSGDGTAEKPYNNYDITEAHVEDYDSSVDAKLSCKNDGSDWE